MFVAMPVPIPMIVPMGLNVAVSWGVCVVFAVSYFVSHGNCVFVKKPCELRRMPSEQKWTSPTRQAKGPSPRAAFA